MAKSKQLTMAFLIPSLVGLTSFIHMMSKPGFANIRSVDVVQLTGSGMCIGVALTALFAILRSKSEG